MRGDHQSERVGVLPEARRRDCAVGDANFDGGWVRAAATCACGIANQADILVVAAGQPLMIGKEDVKKGAVVIDVGIHRLDTGKLCGDVRFDELDGHASAVTPVPRGVGPMTISMLLDNTLRLAEERTK